MLPDQDEQVPKLTKAVTKCYVQTLPKSFLHVSNNNEFQF